MLGLEERGLLTSVGCRSIIWLAARSLQLLPVCLPSFFLLLHCFFLFSLPVSNIYICFILYYSFVLVPLLFPVPLKLSRVYFSGTVLVSVCCYLTFSYVPFLFPVFLLSFPWVFLIFCLVPVSPVHLSCFLTSFCLSYVHFLFPDFFLSSLCGLPVSCIVPVFPVCLSCFLSSSSLSSVPSSSLSYIFPIPWQSIF